MLSPRRLTSKRILSSVVIASLLHSGIASFSTRRASDHHPLLQSRRAMNLDAKLEARGIIFDMDGTLTEPDSINFKAMYERNGLIKVPGEDILTIISKLPHPEKDAALKVIYEEEMIGCDRMKIRPNMHAFLRAVTNSQIPIALSTRNCDAAFQRFMQLADLPVDYFSPALHRDSLNGLNKPDPLVARHILDAWSIQPGTCCFLFLCDVHSTFVYRNIQ